MGVGLDLPWGEPIGFRTHETGRDVVDDRVIAYLRREEASFSHLFVSFQPKGRGRLALDDYAPAFDDLFARAPAFATRALHQTMFNLGALDPYDRRPIVDFTNALVDRYGLAWVNEDLGLWSLHGRPLPYPLPPYLTTAGLRAAVRNTDEGQRELDAPLLVEPPGFSDGVSFVIGELHAYDFFRVVVEETGSAATLDVGHMLG